MAQERALKEYCEKNNIYDYKIFKDENQSGSKTSRPALDELMNEVRASKVSTVIVFAFSRFARSTTHLLNALSEFKKFNTEFVSITEKIETNSPMGVAMFTILGALSHYVESVDMWRNSFMSNLHYCNHSLFKINHST